MSATLTLAPLFRRSTRREVRSVVAHSAPRDGHYDLADFNNHLAGPEHVVRGLFATLQVDCCAAFITVDKAGDWRCHWEDADWDAGRLAEGYKLALRCQRLGNHARQAEIGRLLAFQRWEGWHAIAAGLDTQRATAPWPTPEFRG